MVDEWILLEDYVNVFAQFERITTVMFKISKYPTLSMVIPVLNELKQPLSCLVQEAETNNKYFMKSLCRSLLTSIDRRWPNFEQSPALAIATVLDLVYKDCAFLDAESVTKCREFVIGTEY